MFNGCGLVGHVYVNTKQTIGTVYTHVLVGKCVRLPTRKRKKILWQEKGAAKDPPSRSTCHITTHTHIQSKMLCFFPPVDSLARPAVG
jgi:hypothetical protein